ncbi:hypothetical protein RRF57_001395 [Xylaria bambusicola]|uniref:NB-ARC domain-containing protein n=1 Tax=Xylaria bambusicola TaxID=326684 RepID=A0AAN7UGK7_9PEZI
MIIIFVHGLRGHPQATWAQRQTLTNPRTAETPRKRERFKGIFRPRPTPADTNDKHINDVIFWPRDYLLEDVPEAEVWTYGYNADVIGGLFQANNQNSVSQHGRDLYVKLERHIENDSEGLQAPIIFVAHSLGGIIVKDAIRRSEFCQRRTRLIIFLGTPHRGSSYAAWGVIASNLAKLAFQDSNKRIVQTLAVNDETLDNIHDEFLKLLHGGNIKIHSFCEARAITGIKGLDGKVVDDFSSQVGSPPFETVESIDADHMEMARCTHKNDPRYVAIAGVIRKFIHSGGLGIQGAGAQETVPATQVESQRGRSQGETGVGHNTSLPKARHYIPFFKNKRFTGRASVLDTLKEKLFTEEEEFQTLAIFGLGGVGKTQVALQLAYWVKDNKPEYSVFWVPALGHASFEQAYTEIARQLDIQIKTEKGLKMTKAEEDMKEAVRRYFESNMAGKWLLIVDNADDTDVVLGPSGKLGGIIDYLPKSDHGLTVFTTRSRGVALAVAENNMVELHKMSAEEASEFFEKAIFDKQLAQDKTKTAELVQELMYLPLAIAQAIAYLNQNQTPIQKYLALLQNTKQDMVSLMSREFHDNTRYRESRNAVATTWLVSFDQIYRTNRYAAQLLSFISCIEWKAIPQSILPKTLVQEEMENAIGVLCGYAFLTRRDEEDMFDMHRLVHVATRVWVQNEKLERQTEAGAIQHLASIFPRSDKKNRLLWREYLPHAQHALNVNQEYQDAERFELLYRIGDCLFEDRRYKEAILALEETYQWRKQQFSEEDEYLLMTEALLASAYLDDQQIKKATAMLEHVVAMCKKTLADDNHKWLVFEHELGRAYLDGQRVSEAITVLEHVVAVEKELDISDESKAESEYWLAKAYIEDQRINEAIMLLEHVVAVGKELDDVSDEDKANSEYWLAQAYIEDQRINEAITVLEHVVAVEKKLDISDESKADSEYLLAQAYIEDQRINEAIMLLEHVVAVGKELDDVSDESKALHEYWLAKAYIEDQRINEAITVLEHVVAVEKELDDVSDEDKANSEYWLAQAYIEDQRINEAITVLEHVVAVEKELDDVSDVSKALHEYWLGMAYIEDQRINEAITVLEHVVAVEKELYDVSNESKAISEYWLAQAYIEDQRINEAITVLEHVVAVEKELDDVSDESKAMSQELLERAYSMR